MGRIPARSEDSVPEVTRSSPPVTFAREKLAWEKRSKGRASGDTPLLQDPIEGSPPVTSSGLMNRSRLLGKPTLPGSQAWNASWS